MPLWAEESPSPGGEPLMQGAFLLEVLEQISDLHTAIETSAYASPQLFDRITERLSFIMMDVKLMDAGLHKHYTGVDNTVILENLRSLCRGQQAFCRAYSADSRRE